MSDYAAPTCERAPDGAATSPPRSFQTHWYDRPGWREARRYLTFHLLPPASGSALLAAVERDQAALAGLPGLDLVPPQWLHLTVQGVAFREEISRPQRDALVHRAGVAIAALPPLRLSMSPVVEVHREGVLYSGGPVEPVARLRAALRTAIRDVLDTVPGSDGERIWPHVSIAYANAATPTDAAVAALARTGDGTAVSPTVEFPAVSLIELRTRGHLYLWDLVAEIALSRHGTSGSAG
ncbi:MAG TPA: 2'-5' RNA ligase family protein [Dermatophilaceae bacterium]|nr:2'-5' RNA ligase family protein [Dermatophilaceae bacterium]